MLAAVVALLSALLLWPAVVNGGPFYMSDTPSYIRGADAAVHRLTGEQTLWTDEFFRRFGSIAGAGASAPTAGPAAAEQRPVVLAGRSIYYGAILYVAHQLGSFWLVALFQAALVALAIVLTITALRRAAGTEAGAPTLLAWGAAVALLTPVGYFTGYLLPDIFGGLALLATLHLIFFWRQNSRPVRLFWFALLAGAALFHTANLLLALGLLILAAAGRALQRLPADVPGLVAVLSTVGIAVVGQGLFGWAVARTTGDPPVRPPFVAARIIHDGPGYDYLREHCPRSELIYCRAADFEVRHSDLLLWSPDPAVGIFQALAPAEQRLASSQESRFVLAVAADRPLQLARSSLRSWVDQLGFLKLVEFNYSRSATDYLSHKLPAPLLEQARATRAFQGRMPVTLVESITIVTVLLSALAVTWMLAGAFRRDARLGPAEGFLLFILLGILANAAICGIASMPAGRYAMRLIWVLPLAAIAAGGLGMAGQRLARSRGQAGANRGPETAEPTGG